MSSGLLTRNIFSAICIVGITLVLCEAATRIFFAFEVGPRVVAYGTPAYRADVTGIPKIQDTKTRRTAMAFEARDDSVERHKYSADGYSKYFANEKKTTRNVDTDERIPVSINSLGFRGPEFSEQKQPGVIRVLTLGASSTFGFYNGDEETWPAQMERQLNDSSEQRRYEVINLGIPHMSSRQVANILIHEGLRLKPDVVAFYQGRNDTTRGREIRGKLERLHVTVVKYSLLASLADHLLIGNRKTLTGTGLSFDALRDLRVAWYETSLNQIHSAAKTEGFSLVVGNQQATARTPYPADRSDRMKLQNVPYLADFERIEKQRTAGEALERSEYTFALHKHLMDHLRTWADRHSIPFADVITAMDADRQELLTWVHLTPRGNTIVARTFADSILKLTETQRLGQR